MKFDVQILEASMQKMEFKFHVGLRWDIEARYNWDLRNTLHYFISKGPLEFH